MRTLLIVDDEQKICRMLAGYFSLRGYDVKTAATGEEALALATTCRPDAVVLDLLMPGMGGMQTLAQMKRRFPTTRVVILSAVDQEEVSKEALARGADAYVSKPLNFAHLGGVVDSLWGNENAPPNPGGASSGT